jgi:hypothetical protein
LEYKKKVELHLLHLTEFRDIDFRSANGRKGRWPTERPNWDLEIRPLVEKLQDCLQSVSETAASNDWPRAFARLHEASTSRYKDKTPWPSELTEYQNLVIYLKLLGL